MVVLKWLHSLVRGNSSEVANQATAAYSEGKVKKEESKTASVDLLNAALVDKAEDLEDLITSGSTVIQRKKLKKNIRKKVAAVIADEFSDPEIIDEITERIADAAEVDPYYKKLFSKETD